MKKEYELLERLATDRVRKSNPSFPNSQKSKFRDWTPMEIVGCIISVSLIVYGSYNMIFPPEDLQTENQWIVDSSKQKGFAHFKPKKKAFFLEKQGEEDEPTIKKGEKEKVEPKPNTVEQKEPLKKLALLDNSDSTRQKVTTQSQVREPQSQSQTTTVSNQRQNLATTQNTSSTQRTNSQTNSQQTSQQQTQQTQQTQTTRRSPNTNNQYATRQPDYYTYQTNNHYDSYQSETYETYTYQSSTYESNESRHVSVKPTNVSDEPGMIEGSP